MSRSKKGSKGPGYEHWGKRGSEDKKTTHKKERAKTKQSLVKEKKEV